MVNGNIGRQVAVLDSPNPAVCPILAPTVLELTVSMGVAPTRPHPAFPLYTHMALEVV
jgi:hypothetical protein